MTPYMGGQGPYLPCYSEKSSSAGSYESGHHHYYRPIQNYSSNEDIDSVKRNSYKYRSDKKAKEEKIAEDRGRNHSRHQKSQLDQQANRKTLRHMKQLES